MATGFNQLLTTLAGIDFFTGLLPFVLTYVVFFIVLEKVPVIGNANSGQRALISIAFAFFVARFIVVNPAYQQFFVQYIGRLSITLIGVLGLMTLLALVGVKLKTDEDGAVNWIGGILALLAISAFTVTGGVSSFLPTASQSALYSNIVGMLGFLLDSGLVWAIVIGVVLLVSSGAVGNGDGAPGFFTAIGDGDTGGGSDDDG